MTTITTDILDTYARVDELGRIKSVISDLTNEADEIKADLIEAASVTGKRAFEGELFRATVSFADKRKVDYPAILATLLDEATEGQAKRIFALVRQHTQIAEGVPTVRVSARKA